MLVKSNTVQREPPWEDLNVHTNLGTITGHAQRSIYHMGGCGVISGQSSDPIAWHTIYYIWPNLVEIRNHKSVWLEWFHCNIYIHIYFVMDISFT